MKTSEFLKQTKEKIKNISQWTRSVPARDEDHNQVDPEDPKAVCFCISGAMLLTAHQKYGADHLEAFKAVTAAETVIRTILSQKDYKSYSFHTNPQNITITSFNDSYNTYHEDVINLLDKSIILATQNENI